MPKRTLFSVDCTTCNARLAVRDESAIGAILACPKCGGFVEIQPPEGYIFASTAAETPVESVAETAGVEAAMPAEQTAQLDAGPAGAAPAPISTEPADELTPSASAASAATDTHHGSSAVDTPPADPSMMAARAKQPPPATRGALASASPAAGSIDGTMDGAPQPPPLPGRGYPAPLEMLMQRWTLWASSSAAFLVVVVGGWALFGGSDDRPPDEQAAAASKDPESPETDNPNPDNLTAGNSSEGPADHDGTTTEGESAVDAATDGEVNSGSESNPATGSAEEPPSDSVDGVVPNRDGSGDDRPLTVDSELVDSELVDAGTVEDGGPDRQPADDPLGAGAEGAEGDQAAVRHAQPSSNLRVAVAADGFTPRRIDLSARLSTPIAEVDFDRVPLGAAVATLGQMGAIPLSFDPDGLHQMGVALSDPVTVKIGPGTLADALAAVLGKAGLGYELGGRQFVVTSPESFRSQFRRRRYTVADLAPNATQVADLAAVIQRLVAPESWEAGGGRGRIEPADGALLITQTGPVHAELIDFCERLRRARGMPLKSRLPSERFDLAPRWQQAHDVLRRKVSANFFEPTPLVEVLGYLGRRAGVDLVIDRGALASLGFSDEVPVELQAVDQPLGEILERLLEQLEMGYRPIDRRTLHITSREKLRARLDREFYPAVELAAGSNADDLKALLAADVPGLKADAMYIDPSSGTLIVAAPPTIHRHVQSLLDQ